MKFTKNQKIQILRAPIHRNKLAKAREYEDEIRLYTEPQTEDELNADSAYKNLCSKIKKRLPPKTYGRITDFIEFPLSAIDLVNGILVELYRVFQAKSVFFSFDVTQEAKNKKIKELVGVLDVHNYVIETGKEVFKNKPNLIVVIDKDKNGNPYIVTVETDRIIDAKVNLDGSVEYIAFYHSNPKENEKQLISFYDEENYTVYEFDRIKQTYTEISEVPHKIGYCPAHSFIYKPFNSKSPYKRLTPISSTIGKIREWQLFDIYKYYSEHFNPFPITEMMKQKCGNPQCDNGWLPGEPYIVDGQFKQTKSVKCTDCERGDSVGIGSIIKLSPKKGDVDNGAGAFKFIAPEITGVEYLSNKLSELETYIEYKAIGKDNVLSKEAVNEDQVKGSFQSRESVLISLKEVLETIYIWIVETSARAYYLGDVEIKAFANFGTEFYLVDETELQSRFKEAKSVGLPDSEVDSIYRQLYTTKYKDNPDEIERMEIIRLLDPLPFKSFDEVSKYKQSGLITDKEFIIKCRLLSFIDRFEQEQTSLVNFGNKLSLSERIKAITNILNTYADEFTLNDPAKQI